MILIRIFFYEFRFCISVVDLGKLEFDLEDLDFEGFDFGFDFAESTMNDDEPDNEKSLLDEEYQIIVECAGENDAQEKYNAITEIGIECRVSTL